ncbi:hypothetical protein FRC04_005305 [Tulasnella sp. 424]|nr:hypothetical protein FRC04_005305 [Tulasnella sp. 424]KAG8976417.1 hypothetical protein FRC05_003660 [Tulasnella sp. 425]
MDMRIGSSSSRTYSSSRNGSPSYPGKGSKSGGKALLPGFEYPAQGNYAYSSTSSDDPEPSEFSATLGYSNGTLTPPGSERGYLRRMSDGVGVVVPRQHSPNSPPSSTTSSPPPQQQQTVTFSTCPSCNTVEHHFYQSSRVCGRCGFKRYFAKDKSLTTMSAVQTPSRTYWRPTRFASNISYAHVREGLEEVDDSVHQMLANWASYSTSYIISLAGQAAQYARDASMQACFIELGNAPGSQPGAPQLVVTNRGMSAMANLEADDLLGTFTVLREEHSSAKARGGFGIVVVLLTLNGTGLAVACRLDSGTL